MQVQSVSEADYSKRQLMAPNQYWDREKYAQIEREALAVEFSTNRLQMYLLGSQEFQIATDHKPL